MGKNKNSSYFYNDAEDDEEYEDMADEEFEDENIDDEDDAIEETSSDDEEENETSEDNEEEESENSDDDNEEEDADEDEEDVDFDDTGKEDDKDDKSSTSEEETSKKQKHTQSKEENSRFAELRRQREREDAEKKKSDDAFNKGLIEGLGGKNPYTNKPIEDEYDLKIYLNMKEIEKRGGDPVEDYADYQKVFLKEENDKKVKAEDEEKKRREDVDKSVDAFKKKYPNIDVSKLANDEEFIEYGGDTFDLTGDLIYAYEKYLKIKNKISKNVEDEITKKKAREMASPGSKQSSKEYHRKSFLKMSGEELKEFDRKLGFVDD